MENFKSFNYLFISYKISEELIWNCHTILYNVNDHRIWNKISFLDVKKSTVFFIEKQNDADTFLNLFQILWILFGEHIFKFGNPKIKRVATPSLRAAGLNHSLAMW